MNKREFIKQREPAWNRFESLLKSIGSRSLKRVTSRDVTEFSRLFRELANDLATVRSRGWGDQLASYLNQLVSQGYNAFYREPPGVFRKVLHFLVAGFPQRLRENVWYFTIAAALFFVPMAVSWAVIQNNPGLASRILPEANQEQYRQMYSRPDADAPPEERRLLRRRQTATRSLAAGFYIQHNTGIALKCFARGITAGIGTVYTLLYNGIAIGAIAGFIVAEADSEMFLSFVITHGAFELTAIAVAGAGGLVIGNAILHPGPRKRLEALKVRGMVAIELGLGAAVMLFIAAMIEGFWSPADIPAVLKYIVGTLAWIVVTLYFLLAGRGTSADAAVDAAG